MSEHQVGASDTFLKNGDMRRLELEGKPVVVARVDDHYFAFGGNCSHYGAPLDQGVLKNHSVICPWHHACFDVRTGERQEPPALNDLAHYPVRIDGGQVCVTLPHSNERQPQGKADGSDARVFVIVGGGAAGNAAAEELRRSGYRGHIILLSAAASTPVDRPNLSKDYLAGAAEADWIPLRDESWYADRDIELRLETRVTQVEPNAHRLVLETGDSLAYDRLLLCTGATARQFRGVEGADLAGIYTLRTLADADRIIAAAQTGKRAVVIGASFIGMEVTSSLAHGRQTAVSVVGADALPFAAVLGERLGQVFQQEHERHGVQFYLKSAVSRFLGDNGRVTGVELKDGTVLPADYVVVGIGVIPATGFLEESGLTLDEKDRSVRVNEQLQTSAPDIYAAGDIARWSSGPDRGTRIEHWRVAQQQGIVAARNMLGQAASIADRVPFFWTQQFDLALRYVGHASAWDEVIFRDESADERSLLAFYLHNGELLAAAGIRQDARIDAVELVLRDHLHVTPDQLRDPQFDLVAFAREQTPSVS